MEETNTQVILLTSLQMELIAIVTLFLSTRDYISFSSTCKAFRKFCSRELVEKLFSGRVLVNRLSIGITTRKISVLMEEISLNCTKKSYDELDAITTETNVIVLENSIVYKGLINRGYFPSKYTIRAYLEFSTQSTSKISYLQNLRPTKKLNMIVPQGVFYTKIHIDNPFEELATFCFMEAYGLWDVIANLEYRDAYSLGNRQYPMAMVTQEENKRCFLVNLRVLYCRRPEKSLEEKVKLVSGRIKETLLKSGVYLESQ